MLNNLIITIIHSENLALNGGGGGGGGFVPTFTNLGKIEIQIIGILQQFLYFFL